MKTSKGKAILMLCASCVPVIYILFFIVSMIVFVLSHVEGKEAETWVRWMFAAHALAILWMFVLISVYLYIIFTTAAVKSEHKPMWAIAIVLLNCIIMPFAWYQLVWLPARAEGVLKPPSPDA
jgi:hypothetical protein